MRLHENPYLPNIIIVALLFLVFFVLKLEQPTGYVTGEPAALAVAPTPLPDGCGTFEQISSKIGIKTKKNMNAGALSGTGCAALADSQYKCPVEIYYQKKLCCISGDCSQGETCEGSGIYNGFCKPVCGTVSSISCSSTMSSITAEFKVISKTAKYKMEWCVVGYAWGTAGKCGSVIDSANTITVSGRDSNTAYALRIRADEAVSDTAGGMSCSAPGEWSSPAKCSTVSLTPLPATTPTPTPAPVPIMNGNFETEPNGNDWTAPDGDNRIWDSSQKNSGLHSYKIKLPTASKCYVVDRGEYMVSAFAYSEDTKQPIYYVAYTDDACERMAGTAIQAAESTAVGAWKGLSGMFHLEYGSVKIFLHTGEKDKYAWFDDIKLAKIY